MDWQRHKETEIIGYRLKGVLEQYLQRWFQKNSKKGRKERHEMKNDLVLRARFMRKPHLQLSHIKS